MELSTNLIRFPLVNPWLATVNVNTPVEDW